MATKIEKQIAKLAGNQTFFYKPGAGAINILTHGERRCVRCGQRHSVDYVSKALHVSTPAEHRRCKGCYKRIVKPPRVAGERKPRAKAIDQAPKDPLLPLKKKRDKAEAKIAEWERALSLAMTKIKVWRNTHKRITARIEAALVARAEGPAGRTRRILVEDES